MAAITRIARHLPRIKSRPNKLTISDQCKVSISCIGCNKINVVGVRNLVRKWADEDYLCKSCHVRTYTNDKDKIEKWRKSFAITAATPEHKKRCAEAARKVWADPVASANIRRSSHIDTPAKQAARKRGLVGFMKKHGKAQLDKMRKKAHDVLRKKCQVDQGFRDKLYKPLKEAWEKEEVREKHQKSTAKASKKLWSDPVYKEKMIKIHNTKEYKLMLSERSKAMWRKPNYREKMEALYADPEYKKKLSIISREVHSRPEVKEKLAKAFARMPSISKQEDVFASILDDMKIGYQRQYFVAWYPFDFLLQNKILVEVNGTFIHNQPKRKGRDAAKAEYIRKYHSDQYILRTIWEHEFGSPERVRSIVSSWLGKEQVKVVDFDFSDVKINIPQDSKDSKIFLSKYHYLGRIGRHGLMIEFRLNDELIACVIFATVTRSQSASRLGFTVRETYELTRLCIHPSYQKKNFASWMITRAVKVLWKHGMKAKCILSFSDPLYNHEGTIYKAAGWELDGITTSSYYYRDNDGYVMHKKTLYNKARSAKMCEADFANQFDYIKVPVPPKYRYCIKK